MKIHVVRKGDTLYEIAQHYGVDMDVLLAANPQIEDPDVLTLGMKIRIPSKGVVEAPPRETAVYAQSFVETQDSYAEPEDDGIVAGEARGDGEAFRGQLDESSDMDVEQWTRGGHVIHYTVKPGDTLWEIAHRFGINLQDLIAANPQIKDPDQINVGDVIRIPRPWHPAPPHYPPHDHHHHHYPYHPPYHHAPYHPSPMYPYPPVHPLPWGFDWCLVPPRGEKMPEKAEAYKKAAPKKKAEPWTPFTVWVPYGYSCYLDDGHYHHYGHYHHHGYYHEEAPAGIYKHDKHKHGWHDKPCDGYPYPYSHMKKMYRGEEEQLERDEA